MTQRLKTTSLGPQSPGDEALLRHAFGSGLPDAAAGEPVLGAAVDHVLSHKGRMVRARVCLAAGAIAGLAPGGCLDLAIAVEYFHTASLVFDDLPSMDDAAERRHAPCVHRVHGEGAAVLAGLALLNRAYMLAWSAMDDCAPADRRRAASYLDRNLGPAGLLGGQSRDLHDPGAMRSERGVIEVACRKTVPLLRLAAAMPFIMGGADARIVQLLERLCAFRGLAYQFADDLLDVLATPEAVGKTTHCDALRGRPNIALLAGVDGARARVRRLNALGDRTMAALPGGPFRWGFLDALRPELPLPAHEGLDLSMASAAV